MTINIALTSYPRRITNCVPVINSVLENTLVPDRIYLTLSHLEFPNYEQSLPIDLYRLIMTSNKVILNWVEDNYKSMKKVFPILPYLEDEDVIIDIDDDMILPKDFIESRVRDFKDYGCKYPITSNLHKSINMDNMVMSCYSLFQKKMLNGYQKFVDETVLNTFNDDRTYLYLCHMNGFMLKPCSKYCIGESGGMIQQLSIAPHEDYEYKIGTKYDKIVSPVISNLSNGKSINECFGLFNEIGINIEQHDDIKQKPKTKIERQSEDLSIKPISGIVDDGVISKFSSVELDIDKLFQYNLKKPIKHDIVYVLGKGSKNDNLEIRISIASMMKFCSHWINNIYIVGENPHISNNNVKHIYAPDITKVNKDANIIHKLLSIIQKVPGLTDNFLFCSDDILVTKKTDWEDFAPRYIFEYKQDSETRNQLYRDSQGNAWDRLLLKTLDRFLGLREHIYFYEPHIFAPINKKYFKQMASQIEYTKSRNVIIMSLWFNWLNLKNPQPRYDHKSVFSRNIPDLSEITERHLTYNDPAFSIQKFKDWLISLVTQ